MAAAIAQSCVSLRKKEPSAPPARWLFRMWMEHLASIHGAMPAMIFCLRSLADRAIITWNTGRLAGLDPQVSAWIGQFLPAPMIEFERQCALERR